MLFVYFLSEYSGCRSAGGGSGGKRGVAGGSCGGGCACGGGNAVRLANEPLLSLVLTCLRHQDDQKVLLYAIARVPQLQCLWDLKRSYYR